jgi:hypothetical protein
MYLSTISVIIPETGISRKFLSLIQSYHGFKNELFSCKKVGGSWLSATRAHDRMAFRGSASSSLAAPGALVDR